MFKILSLPSTTMAALTVSLIYLLQQDSFLPILQILNFFHYLFLALQSTPTIFLNSLSHSIYCPNYSEFKLSLFTFMCDRYTPI